MRALRHTHLAGYFVSQQFEMCGIPGVNHVGFGFAGTCGYQRVVNCSTYNSHPCDAVDSGEILIAVEPYQRKSALNFLHEERCGSSAQALLPGIPGKSRIRFGEAVSGATGVLTTRRGERSEAARMVHVVWQERWHQDGGVEEPFHRRFFRREARAE